MLQRLDVKCRLCSEVLLKKVKGHDRITSVQLRKVLRANFSSAITWNPNVASLDDGSFEENREKGYQDFRFDPKKERSGEYPQREESLLRFSKGHHIGNTSLKTVSLPQNVTDVINDLLYVNKSLVNEVKKESKRLEAFLISRQPPYLNENQIRFDRKKWKTEMIEKLTEDEDLTPEQKELFKSEIESEAEKRYRELKNISGFWKALSYDSYNVCLAYTLARAAPNYAVTLRALNEIWLRDPSFEPEKVLDFGSGCGTFTWAVSSLWPQQTKYFYLNDVSSEFNKVSCQILAGDDVEFIPTANGVYYKLHLPVDVRPSYDLVFSGYTLSELHSPGSRISSLKHLLKCTKKYIVFVENGTLRSQHLIEQLREYVALNLQDQFEVFAPCPHLKPCPLLILNLRGNQKNLICRTAVSYLPFPLRNHPQQNSKWENFTYVVFRRKPDPTAVDISKANRETVPSSDDDKSVTSLNEMLVDKSDWPRIVQNPKRSSGLVTLRLCCSDGNAYQSVITRSTYPWYFYRASKNSSLGDRLLVTEMEEKLLTETDDQEELEADDAVFADGHGLDENFEDYDVSENRNYESVDVDEKSNLERT